MRLRTTVTASRRFVLALTLAAMGVGVLGPAADARSRNRDDRGTSGGYVVAESRWGHGTVSGAVRPGPRGWQVRTPGGSWIDCVRNRCSETLRLATVDIFEVMEQKDGGPNYFRFERRF